MVLEGLISPVHAEKSPWKLILLGILYSTAGIMLAMMIFPKYAGLVAIFFTVFASIPTMYLIIKMEEKKDLVIREEKMLLKEHGRALAAFTFLFLGFVISFSIWHVFLPADNAVFSIQEETIKEINNPLAGNAFNVGSSLISIILNNMRVLVFCLLFAFFYGFGAIFILTWNASIVATAIGNAIKSHMGLAVVPFALLRYLLHGIPEIVAYFMAGLAGGIISIAVIRHDFSSKHFKRILVDSLDLTFGAVLLLVLAAILEVFISPLVL